MMQNRTEYNIRRKDMERFKEEMKKQNNSWEVHKEYG